MASVKRRPKRVISGPPVLSGSAFCVPANATATARVFRHDSQARSLPWVILYLSTMATEVEALAAAPAGAALWERLLTEVEALAAAPAGAALWERLLTEGRPEALAAIVVTGLEHG